MKKTACQRINQGTRLTASEKTLGQVVGNVRHAGGWVKHRAICQVRFSRYEIRPKRRGFVFSQAFQPQRFGENSTNHQTRIRPNPALAEYLLGIMKRTPKSRVSYSRKEMIQVLRTINELVVSLDHVSSASYDMTKAQNDAALSDFIWRHKILRKAAVARRILSAPFPTKLGPDDMDELERAMQRVRYWTVRSWKTRKRP